MVLTGFYQLVKTGLVLTMSTLPVIGHYHIISCIPPLIINPNSMVVAHVILVTALVQKIGLGFLETDSELSH